MCTQEHRRQPKIERPKVKRGYPTDVGSPEWALMEPLLPLVEHLLSATAYDCRTLMDKATFMDLTIEMVRTLKGQQGCAVQPKHWVMERTVGCLVRWRRLMRDYEQRIDVSHNMVISHWVPQCCAGSFSHE